MTETPPAHDSRAAPKLPAISFEFFPPKTEEMERSLWETINRLAPLAPNFVSVTYGAGGSTRERTHSTIARILYETTLTPAAHLTCVDARRPTSTTSWRSIMRSAFAISWHCAAIPRPDSALPMLAHPRRLPDFGRSRCRHPETLSAISR